MLCAPAGAKPLQVREMQKAYSFGMAYAPQRIGRRGSHPLHDEIAELADGLRRKERIMDTQTLVEFKSGDAGTLAKVTTESIADDMDIVEFNRELQAYVGTHPGASLHLDLSHVEFFSSAVLVDLLQVQQALQKADGALHLHGIHGNVRAIMKLTGLANSFH
jgi:anti-anti-sigma factor